MDNTDYKKLYKELYSKYKITAREYFGYLDLAYHKMTRAHAYNEHHLLGILENMDNESMQKIYRLACELLKTTYNFK